jgi:hypothetical protein
LNVRLVQVPPFARVDLHKPHLREIGNSAVSSQTDCHRLNFDVIAMSSDDTKLRIIIWSDPPKDAGGPSFGECVHPFTAAMPTQSRPQR